jgi:UDP-glucose 4-epimerase
VATNLFLEKGFEVVGIDNFSTGYRQPLELLQKKFGSKDFRFYEADLRDDLSLLFKKEKGIKAVVHYAASCSVNESMEDPLKYFSNNTCGSQNLFRQMLEHDIKHLVFSSTCAVYGEAQYVPVDEKHPTAPSNPYGESKLMIEKMIEWLGKLKDFHFVILRYFNVCGASDDSTFGDSKKPSMLLVQNAVRGALGLAPFSLTCPKVETPDRTPIRDYLNVVDLNVAHLLALDYLFSGGQSEVINLGTGTGNSVLEIVNVVQKVTGKKFALGKSNPRQGEYAVMIAEIKKAKKVLGWQPKRSLEQSIRSLVRWYQNRPQGWDYLRSES